MIGRKGEAMVKAEPKQPTRTHVSRSLFAV